MKPPSSPPPGPADEPPPAGKGRAQPVKRFLSTFEVARQLDLSVGTVQRLVEAGELHGWHTHGGHRRITPGSVEAYQRYVQHVRASAAERQPDRLKVLVVDPDTAFLRTLRRGLAGPTVSLSCQFAHSWLDAMVELQAQPPDVVFTALRFPDVEATDVLHQLERLTNLAPLGLVAWGAPGAAPTAAGAALPRRTLLLRERANAVWIDGYLCAVALHARQAPQA